MTRTRQAKPRLGELKMALLGKLRVSLGAVSVQFSRRKTLALLAYLALEPQAHPREKLAALLWPDSEGSRTSLRTALAELKAELGSWLVVDRDSVALEPDDLELDLYPIESAVRSAQDEAQLEAALKLFRGDLLEGFDLSDAPEFDDWLLAEREVVRGWRDSLLERLANLQSQAGKFAVALENAQQRLRLEPLNEAAHRQVIEIHLANGNRSAALEAFNACRELLLRELGLEPDPQTQGLLTQFRTPSAAARAPSVRRAMLETPLVGREREWALMEEAWEAGQAIIVHGAPGVGKSRLIEEFAASRGAYLHCSGRPGDALVPYGTHARTFKQITDTFDLAEIPRWVRWELSRIIPELGENPPPLESEADKLRFFEAKAEILRLYFAKGCAVMAFDDVQFVDAASLEAGFYALFKFLPAGPGLPRSIHSYRTDELPENAKALIQQAVDNGLAALIELKPLEPAEVGQLLSSLEVSDQLAQPLHRFTGGNPLFLLETVRSLAQRGSLSELTPERFENRRRVSGLPRSPKVQAIIGRRLDRLSPQARDLSRVAALMGEYFNLELGAKALEKGLLETSQAAEELEATQVWHGDRFSHDLIFETTLENIPESLAPILHKRVMEVFETVKTPAAVLAHHAYSGGQWKKALGYSLQAAWQSENNPDAVHLEHCLRVKGLVFDPPKGFDPLKDVSSDQRIELYQVLRNALEVTRRVEEADQFTSQMLEYARQIGDARLEIRVLLPNYPDSRLGRELEGQMMAQALAVAERIEDRHEWVWVQTQWMYMEYMNHEFEEALARGEKIYPIAQSIKPAEVNASNVFGPYLYFLQKLAQANIWSGYWDSALKVLREVEVILRPFPEYPVELAEGRLWQAVCLFNLGAIEESLPIGREAMEIFCKLNPYHPFDSVPTLWHSRALMDHGDLMEGLEVSSQALEMVKVPKTDVFWTAPSYLYQSWALQLLGQLEPALEYVLRALEENREQARRNGWGLGHQDYISSVICTIYALQNDWDKACEYALLAAQSRFAANNEVGANTPRMRRDLETEALLRGGEVELARESVRRLGEFAGHYARRQIPYLRALAVLEAWEGKLESAIGHLEVARGLMTPIGLPNERWTLELQLAKLYAKAGRFEQAEEARKIALETTESLAEKISDLELKRGFLEFVGHLEEVPLWVK